VRKELIENLSRELLGPKDGPVETFESPLPSQKYIIGVLYPSESQVDSEQDDGSSEESDSSEEDTIAGAKVSVDEMLLPSSMGLSFVVGHESMSLDVTVSWAVYIQEEKWGKFVRKEQSKQFNLILKEGENKEEKIDDEREFYLSWRISPIEGKNIRHVSVFLVNRESKIGNDKAKRDQSCIFTPKLRFDDKSRPFFSREMAISTSADEDIRSLRLLYHDRHEFAIGHGCSVDWNDVDGDRCGLIETTYLPIFFQPSVDFFDEKYRLSMKLLSMESMKGEMLERIEKLLIDYQQWIKETFTEEKLKDFEPGLKSVVVQHESLCNESLGRIKEGVDLIRRDKIAFKAFCFMNEAMLLQRLQHDASLIYRNGGKYLDPDLSTIDFESPPRWRPFQLAFILQALPDIFDPSSKNKGKVDLLWIPTGGGKTEAYLGLAAFAIGIRRLKTKKMLRYLGVSAIMRYTMRLLTIQQFERTVSLAAACEVLRARNQIEFGFEPIQVGLYVGKTTTPNRIGLKNDYSKGVKDTAWYALKYWDSRGEKPQESNPFQLKYCPWCGQVLDLDSYSIEGNHLLTHCTRDGCPFSKDLEIPALTVDQDIYSKLPSIIVATVDKFAMMPYSPRIATLFGRTDVFCQKCGFMLSEVDFESSKEQHSHGPDHLIKLKDGLDPPELIIQDELHLITGPLGSMVGMYETAIDYFSSKEINGQKMMPKYIASTATIRRARDQLWNLFVRDVRRFPPSGVSYDDSFFVKEVDDEDRGKCYLGIFPSGVSQKTSMIRALSEILIRLAEFKKKGVPVSEWDEFWTVVMYFNAIRELGSAITTMEDDVQNRIGRKIRDLMLKELTSRIDSRELPEILDWLNIRGDESAIDVLACSNMFSVGVDVQRLGLMIVNNQPKTVSEYIQSTGRVGRKGTGLVIVLYNWARPRDQSHYERFVDFHNRIQYHVEAMTVTPFSAGVLDRAVHAQYVVFARVLNDKLKRNNQAGAFYSTVRASPPNNGFATIIEDRMKQIDNPVVGDLTAVLEDFLDRWEDGVLSSHGKLDYKLYDFNPNPILMAMDRDEIKRQEGPRVLTPTSMRNVEAEIDTHKVRKLGY
jgi:hypothetical protein